MPRLVPRPPSAGKTPRESGDAALPVRPRARREVTPHQSPPCLEGNRRATPRPPGRGIRLEVTLDRRDVQGEVTGINRDLLALDEECVTQRALQSEQLLTERHGPASVTVLPLTSELSSSRVHPLAGAAPRTRRGSTPFVSSTRPPRPRPDGARLECGGARLPHWNSQSVSSLTPRLDGVLADAIRIDVTLPQNQADMVPVFDYFMVRVTRTQPTRNALAGLSNAPGTGEKRSFSAGRAEPVGLVAAWSVAHSKLAGARWARRSREHDSQQ